MNNLFGKIKLYGFLKSILFAYSELYNIFCMRVIKGSFSQNGEDLVIDKLLNYKKTGFYVDIGAYDPYRFSNTYRFYKKGWRGINIEPNINNYKKFIIARSKDMNLNIGIGTKTGSLTFYIFFPDTLSTFSTKEALEYEKMGFKKIKELKVYVKRLDKVFLKYRHKDKVDFLSIDTEGFEMEVLKSNNWKKFRPKIICIESFTFNNSLVGSRERKDIGRFLSKMDYIKVYSNDTNIIYLDNR